MSAVWAILALSVPFIFAASSPIQGDTWWTLKTGELIVRSRRLLDADPFSYSAHPGPFVDAQWLAQVIYYLAYLAGGLEGVAAFTALLVTAIFAVVLHLAYRRSGNVRVAAACVLAAAGVSVSYFLAWAQTLGFLCFVVTWWLLTGDSGRRRALAGIVVVEVLWANAHGSFVLGPALTGLLALGDGAAFLAARKGRGLAGSPRLRFLVTALGLQIVATLATPYGLGIYRYVLAIDVNPAIRTFISAWQPTSVASPTGLAFFGSVGLVLAAIGLSGKRPGLDAIVILAFFAVLGLQAVRNVPWWSLASTPILAEHLASAFDRWRAAKPTATTRRESTSSAAPALLAGLVILFAGFSLPWTKQVNPLLPAAKRGIVDPTAPVAAADYLLAHQLPGHVLGYQPWGGYLEWRLWPRYSLLVDERIEVHAPSVWIDYQYITIGQATWQERLDREGVDVLLLDLEQQSDLVAAVRASPRWHSVFEGARSALFVRTQ